MTGTNGRALLDRDGDRIQITPNARMELAPTATSTTVLQRAGRAVYDIVTGGRPRFKVETPYLVAGVKGTVFSVTVTTTGASVSVSEGVVSVDPPTPSGFSAADVGAGQSAAVAVEAGSLSITVGDTPAGDVPAPLHDDSTRSAAPERGNSTATSARGTGRGNANGRRNSQGRGQAAAQFDGDVVSIDTSSAGGGGGGGGGDGGNAGGNSGGGGNA
ncbi:MAG: FecR domain-containing protein [Alphaproteobacteria bacterium]